jgi:hypothetical protein
MATVASVTTLLKKKGTEKMRAMYARHGMAAERCYGVSMADLKIIAKTIKGQQALAGELYATGMLAVVHRAADDDDTLGVPHLRRSELFCMVTPPLRAGLTYAAPTGLVVA